MRKVNIWLLSGLVVALLLWLLAESLAVNLQAGRSVPLFSVYRYDPLGMAAFDQYRFIRIYLFLADFFINSFQD